MRSIWDVKARALTLARPLTAHLELTYHCNWRCVFCFNPRHSDLKRMGLAEWVMILDDLRSLGTLHLTLSGGEPLTHPEFFEIARAAAERAFTIRIFTNGALIDEAAADQIAALRPLAVEMSLHGATADVHEQTTARVGSHRAVFDAASRLSRRRVPVVLKTTVTRLNEHQLDDMVKLCAELGYQLQIGPTVTARDDGDPGPLAYTASREGIRRALELGIGSGSIQPVDRVEGGVNCGLGRMTVAIDPEGNVYPCMQWRHSSMGNVRERRLRDLWDDSAIRKEAAGVAVAANDRMRSLGEPLSSFSFCPALAFQHTGDVLGVYESFEVQARIASEVRDLTPS